jgi:hypothetical protein
MKPTWAVLDLYFQRYMLTLQEKPFFQMVFNSNVIASFQKNQNHRKGHVVLGFPYPSKRDAKLREKGLDHFLYTLTWAWLPSPTAQILRLS